MDTRADVLATLPINPMSHFSLNGPNGISPRDGFGEYETFGEKVKIVAYEGWNMPDFGDMNTLYAIGLIILGGVVIWGMEKMSGMGE